MWGQVTSSISISGLESFTFDHMTALCGMLLSKRKTSPCRFTKFVSFLYIMNGWHIVLVFFVQCTNMRPDRISELTPQMTETLVECRKKYPQISADGAHLHARIYDAVNFGLLGVHELVRIRKMLHGCVDGAKISQHYKWRDNLWLRFEDGVCGTSQIDVYGFDHFNFYWPNL